MQFLYMGFSQQANIRHFRFQGVLPRERPTKVARSCEFSLSADMALLADAFLTQVGGPYGGQRPRSVQGPPGVMTPMPPGPLSDA